ncbi:MAG: hypothetical protein RHS_1139 [Robinsoniella sp. RHS]|nr:MAG: hypothetical protein RHS_1139 [Robinsoniella sp. RHS]
MYLCIAFLYYTINHFKIQAVFLYFVKRDFYFNFIIYYM